MLLLRRCDSLLCLRGQRPYFWLVLPVGVILVPRMRATAMARPRAMGQAERGQGARGTQRGAPQASAEWWVLVGSLRQAADRAPAELQEMVASLVREAEPGALRSQALRFKSSVVICMKGVV